MNSWQKDSFVEARISLDGVIQHKLLSFLLDYDKNKQKKKKAAAAKAKKEQEVCIIGRKHQLMALKMNEDDLVQFIQLLQYFKLELNLDKLMPTISESLDKNRSDYEDNTLLQSLLQTFVAWKEIIREELAAIKSGIMAISSNICSFLNSKLQIFRKWFGKRTSRPSKV